MVIAVFDKNTKHVTTNCLWQWDYGQILRIQGLHLPQAVEIHFSKTWDSGDSTTRIGVTKDSVTDVTIPDSVLERTGSIYAFVYLRTESAGETECKITIPLKERPKPEIPGTSEEGGIFEHVLETVKTAIIETRKSEENTLKHVIEAKEYSDNAANDRIIVEQIAETFSNTANNATQALEKIIESGDESKKNLDESINNANDVEIRLKGAIDDADKAVDTMIESTKETKRATGEAHTAEGKLKQSTADAEELKSSLDQAMGGVAQDATAEEILKILQISADYMAQIAESAGKAGSLNGFGLNLMDDGSVSLTYSDPDTGELQDSAIFPKETTLAALDKALGEMNESLKIIALREGGTL